MYVDSMISGGDEVQVTSSGADLLVHGAAHLALGAELLNLGADLVADYLALGASLFADRLGLSACVFAHQLGLTAGRRDSVRRYFDVVVGDLVLKREPSEGQ